MKRIIITTVVLFASSLMAQTETLFGNDLESGGYGGPLVQIGQVYGETGVFFGGQGGWVINKKFVLGGKGYGLVNELQVDGSPNLRLEFGCGGLFLEYIIDSDKLYHFSVHSMIGAGGVSYAEKQLDEGQDNGHFNGDAFFVFEPGISVILNINSFLRAGAGVAYRYIDGLNYDTLSNSDFSGAGAQIFLKFGEF